MEKVMIATKSVAQCGDESFSKCIAANIDLLSECGGEALCKKYIVFIKRGVDIRRDAAVDCIDEAEFVLKGWIATCDTCWVEKCVGGEWVTVRTSRRSPSSG